MFTNPTHFAKWMGPVGWKLEFIKTDVKEGGSLHYSMETNEGQVDHYSLVKYKKNSTE